MAAVAAVALYAAGWVVVNGGILVLSRFASAKTSVPSAPADLRGLRHLQPVDSHLWRSSAPTDAAEYRDLRRAGVTTIVDLRQLGPRAEGDEARLLRQVGLHLVVIPIPDGGVPSSAQVAEFLRVVADTPGRVLVHCGAGVGRTGTLVAAYLVSTGQATGRQAMMRMLAVGPPSLAQLVFEYQLAHGEPVRSPDRFVDVVSRAFDEPRILMHSF